MKPPTKCTCHVHASEDFDISKCNPDPKLNRRVRRDCLAQTLQCRTRILTELNPEKRAWLESVAICAEWTAWTCLLVIRELKTRKANR